MAIIRNHFLAAAITSAFFLSGCVKEKIIHERQAPENIMESFNQSVECAQASCVTITKESLGKIFLLIASGKTGGAAPQWYDLKPLVVSFEKSGGKIALLGENYNSIYEEIKTVHLIQTFDILNEDESSVTFDWGAGLKTLILERSFDVDGVLGGKTDFTDSSMSSISVLDSYVRNITFDEKNIELEQISKIKQDSVQDGAVAQREETLAMNIQIRAYNLGTEFKPKIADASRRVGFFVTKTSQPGYSGGVNNLITKWDISEGREPIQVRISKAVPEEYVAAVAEGALYWNKVFGRDVLEVVAGVDEQEGPKDRSISLRWIPWLDSGAAYAMGQSDPLTGEILRAQVFMPSVFTRVGSATLVALNDGIPVSVGAMKCDLSAKLRQVEELSREASESQRLRIAQDSVRSTVAHELGHALGLRHNFAGSFSAKVGTSSILDEASKYLRDIHHKGIEASTTIMDYLAGVDDVLVSAHLKFGPLVYDKMAMDWAYAEDDAALDEEKSLYCTDDDIAIAQSMQLKIYGCERFDIGNNPFLRSVLDGKREIESFVNTLTVSILGRLFPGQNQDVANMETVIVETLQWAKLQTPSLESVRDFMFDNPKGQKFVALETAKAGAYVYATMGQDTALLKQRQEALAEAGGYSGVLSTLLYRGDGSMQFDWLEKQIMAVVQSGYLESGKTLSGRDYVLTQEQRTWIMAFYQVLRDQNKRSYEDLMESLLPKVNSVVNTPKGPQTITEIFLSGRLDQAEGEELAQIWLDLSHYQKGVLQAKYGPNLALSLDLPQRGLDSVTLKKWMAMLKKENIGLDVSSVKSRQYELELRRLAQVMKDFGYHSTVNTEQGIQEAVRSMSELGQLDKNASNWVLSELSRAKLLVE